jgi:hypothetical protein
MGARYGQESQPLNCRFRSIAEYLSKEKEIFYDHRKP